MNTTSFLPFFGTDFGLCSVIKPQVTFSPDAEIRNLPWDQKMFGGTEVRKGAKVGKSNGLSMLLDAETYDYMFTVGLLFNDWPWPLVLGHPLYNILYISKVKASEGFKMSVQHHLDQPLMQINEIDISPGFESQVKICHTNWLIDSVHLPPITIRNMATGNCFDRHLLSNYFTVTAVTALQFYTSAILISVIYSVFN